MFKTSEPQTVAEAAAPEAIPASARRGARLRAGLSPRNISAAYVLAGFVILYAFWVPDTFLTWANVKSVLANQAITALLAVGLVVPLAAAVFDLSVATLVGVASVLSAELMTSTGLSWPVAVLVTLGAGCAVGLANAVLIVGFSVPSMIGTLAMSSVLTGLGTAIGNDNVITGLPNQFSNLGSKEILGLPIPVYVLLAVSVIFWYALEHTKSGRYVYATGGNYEAARLAGVRTRRIVVATLAISGVAAAFTGVVDTASVGAGEFLAGPPYLLPAFAAAFLGSTQFKSGQFNVWGTILATYTLAFGVKGLTLAGAPSWLPDVFNGVALGLAVALSVRRSRQTMAGRMWGKRHLVRDKFVRARPGRPENPRSVAEG